MSLVFKDNSVDAPMSFTLFPLLLKEIRLLIWQYCSLHPRVITLPHKYQHPIGDGKRLLYCSLDRECCTSGNAPALLHVNQESREVGLKIYELLFKGIPQFDKQPLYFNFSQDSLYLRERGELFLLRQELGYKYQQKCVQIDEFENRLQHLIVEETFNDSFHSRHQYFLFLKNTRKLETIVLKPFWYSCGALIDPDWLSMMKNALREEFKLDAAEPELLIRSEEQIIAMAKV